MRVAPSGGRGQVGLVLALVGWSAVGFGIARAQTELSSSRRGVVRIVNTDMAVLESPEKRNDLPCEVVPLKPELAFDLRFPAGYRITIPP